MTHLILFMVLKWSTHTHIVVNLSCEIIVKNNEKQEQKNPLGGKRATFLWAIKNKMSRSKVFIKLLERIDVSCMEQMSNQYCISSPSQATLLRLSALFILVELSNCHHMWDDVRRSNISNFSLFLFLSLIAYNWLVFFLCKYNWCLSFFVCFF